MPSRRHPIPVARNLLLLLLAVVAIAASQPEQADLILISGKVWTADPASPWAEAVAVKNGLILFAGSSREAQRFGGPGTEQLDVSGKLVLPGFIDSHIHLVGGALSLDRVDLTDETTLEAVQSRIRKFAADNPKNAWILGRGWLYSTFPGGLPTRQQLDAAVPDRPAYMDCYDGHTGWANTKALEAAGITRDTKDPEDGLIVRDPKTGEPTGALKESAAMLVDSRIPRPDDAARYRLLVRAFDQLSSQGITSVQDADYSMDDLKRDLKIFERAKQEGRMKVRVIAAVRMEQENFAEAVAEARRLADSHSEGPLRFGTVKAYVDGVIEARTAAMLEPYADSTERGSLNWDPEKLNEAAILADKAHLQIYMHAIGDRGVRTALDAYQAVLKANGPADRRGRVEHIETISQQDYARFRELGVIASMQPLHADPNQNIFDVWARNTGSERSTRAFSWRNFEKAGVTLTFGSDWPVVTSSVLRGVYCAVTRKTKEGTPAGGWHPELAVSLENALRHYTIDAAYASFDEKMKGSIAAGKYADITVLSEDIFKSPPENILRAQVLLTVENGRIVYRSPQWEQRKVANARTFSMHEGGSTLQGREQ